MQSFIKTVLERLPQCREDGEQGNSSFSFSTYYVPGIVLSTYFNYLSKIMSVSENVECEMTS